MPGTRKDMHRVTVKVGPHQLGEWETRTGGKTSTNATMNKPGAMKPAVSLGGVPTTDTITLDRNFDARDAEAGLVYIHDLIGYPAIVRQQPLGPDGNPYGAAIVWDGLLSAYTPPESDANSEDAARMTIEIAVNGVPTLV